MERIRLRACTHVPYLFLSYIQISIIYIYTHFIWNNLRLFPTLPLRCVWNTVHDSFQLVRFTRMVECLEYRLQAASAFLLNAAGARIVYQLVYLVRIKVRISQKRPPWWIANRRHLFEPHLLQRMNDRFSSWYPWPSGQSVRTCHHMSFTCTSIKPKPPGYMIEQSFQ